MCDEALEAFKEIGARNNSLAGPLEEDRRKIWEHYKSREGRILISRWRAKVRTDGVLCSRARQVLEESNAELRKSRISVGSYTR